MTLFDKHDAKLNAAVDAVSRRTSWTAFNDNPTSHPHGADGKKLGWNSFESILGGAAPLDQHGKLVEQECEISPYTGEGLRIAYPRATADDLLARSETGARQWARTSVETRTGICMEILDQLYLRSFELQAASVHTTGQSAAMAFTGNGTNALDRGLEAVAQAYLAMSRVAKDAAWTRQFGQKTSTIAKRYSLVPKGTAVAIACASFPAWNTYPALLASLVSGNPVIVKPHPSSVITLALAVQSCREVLAAEGFPPDLVTLAVDATDQPIAKQIVTDPRCGIVDFTGSPQFGRWLENNLPGKSVYTETAGVNSVVLESAENLPSVARAIGGGLSLFSAQMCTSPQNIYIPRAGISTDAGHASYADVVGALVDSVDTISQSARKAASIMGAIQAESTIAIQDDVTSYAMRSGRIIRHGAPYEHPEFEKARTRTPMIAEVDKTDLEVCGEECFGPNAFILPVQDAAEGLALASRNAVRNGAIAAYVYSRDEVFLESAEESSFDAGVNLTINAVGPMPMNFSAAYSDYHVTGANPAGNATLTDEAFVAGRFRVVQTRRQI